MKRADSFKNKIAKEDAATIEWATGYLERTNQWDSASSQSIQDRIYHLEDTPSGQEYLKRMEKAYYKKEQRIKERSNNRKSFNFVLSVHIQDKLRDLSKTLHLSRNKVVESLIEKEYRRVEKKQELEKKRRDPGFENPRRARPNS